MKMFNIEPKLMVCGAFMWEAFILLLNDAQGSQIHFHSLIFLINCWLSDRMLSYCCSPECCCQCNWNFIRPQRTSTTRANQFVTSFITCQALYSFIKFIVTHKNEESTRYPREKRQTHHTNIYWNCWCFHLGTNFVLFVPQT